LVFSLKMLDPNPELMNADPKHRIKYCVMAQTKDAGGLMSVENGYAECYPGLMEMEDAIGDSDEETDYRLGPQY
jgi:hypothetical protein